jgi:glycerophosphoryl diester phosphodiesterase
VSRPVEIIAHRGAAAGAVDNSLIAFERAITLGADRIEFDVRKTSEGELIAYHDPIVRGDPVGALTRSEIRTRTGHLPPLLTEVLELAHDRIKLDIELKEPGCVDAVLAAIAEPDRAVITSFIDEVVAEVKAREPRITTGLLLGQGRPRRYLRTRASELLPHDRVHAAGVDLVAPHFALVRAGVLRRVEIPALVWTVNDTKMIAKMMDDDRVAGIITDVPDLALQLRG